MFYRRKLLIRLLSALERPVTRTELQKFLFLVCEEQRATGERAAYDFVPYRYGCYSFQAEADKKTLTKYGLLRENDRWVLARKRRMPTGLHPRDAAAIDRVVQQVGDLRGSDLVAHVYREFPYYAIHSEVREELLTANELAAVEAATPRGSGRRLFTIGYEGRSLEAYLNSLISARVRVLCDVRRNPLSMKFGFNKGQLANAVTNLGISYVHMPELGIASVKRARVKSEADRRALFAEYKRTTLVENEIALERIATLIVEHKRVALTCFEADHENCHRGCVAAALERAHGLKAAAHL